MSFSGTPLGQIRRLDQNTFLNRQNSNGNISQAQPQKSSAPGAYSLASRSRSVQNIDNGDEVASYALRQQQQNLTSANTKLRPDRWTVNDTSVQVANAFQQAATEMHSSNPNYTWASQAPRQTVPRSTSVEYESQSQQAAQRRLAGPPSRRGGAQPLSRGNSIPTMPPPVASNRARPLRRGETTLVIPESEENRSNGSFSRQKSPFEAVAGVVGAALGGGASFLMRRRQQEKTSQQQEESYDYAEEEAAVRREQAASAASVGSTSSTANSVSGQQQNGKKSSSVQPSRKATRISDDNKAYQPTESDLDESDEEVGDDRRRKRRTKKKDGTNGGPLTSLPVAGYDKRRKPRRVTRNGTVSTVLDDDETGSDEPEMMGRPPISQVSSSGRGGIDSSLEYPYQEAGLHSINEQDEELSGDAALSPPDVDGTSLSEAEPHLRQSHRGVVFSLGGTLGYVVNVLYRLGSTLLGLCGEFLRGLTLFLGRVIGHTFAYIAHPFTWLGANPSQVAAVITVALLATSFMALRDPLRRMFSGSGKGVYYPPSDTQPQDISELAARLLRMENVVSGLSLESLQFRNVADQGVRTGEEVRARLNQLEARIREEMRRAEQVEERSRQFEKTSVADLKRDIASLHHAISSMPKSTGGSGGSDAEARARLYAIEERLAQAELDLKESLEMGRNAAGAVTRVEEQLKSGVPYSGNSGAWWQKVISGSGSKDNTLTIKASDGRDVTGLIAELVDTAVGRTQRDDLARPDYAMHSGGGSIIPSLTSDTFQVRPSGLKAKTLAFFTGHGYAVGRPPITALHHELHIGHCWPFVGSQGQLGVKLAAPTYIDDITIDHVAKEVAYDMRSAPKDMEVWGLVEGEDNLAKVREYYEAKARAREERQAARAAGAAAGGNSPESNVDEEEEAQQPPSLPQGVTYIRIASFTYDIDAPTNIQTFAVDQGVRSLGVDFGVVVLNVKSNWGMNDFTCLYRMRVHGERREVPLLESEEPLGA